MKISRARLPSPEQKQKRRSPSPGWDRDDRRGRNYHSPSPSPPDSEYDKPCGLISREITEAPLPIDLEKPPTLGTYSKITDPDEHIDNINAPLDYQGIRGAIKYRLFPTTFKKGAMAWYKSLRDESFTSWKQLKRILSRHFTASRRHPKSKVSLEMIIQSWEESL